VSMCVCVCACACVCVCTNVCMSDFKCVHTWKLVNVCMGHDAFISVTLRVHMCVRLFGV